MNAFNYLGKLLNEEEKDSPKFKVGDKVKLKDDVLQRHSRSVPAHAGYTREQFSWRDSLRKLKGKTGTIERLFSNSKHVNVDFDGHVIGINSTELVAA